MGRIALRFFAELNDFLPPSRRQRWVEVPFVVKTSIKDLIEGLGVPHPEVDLILANGDSVDFAYGVGDGDRVSVYPAFHTLAVADLSRVRPEPLEPARFVLDVHLGRLARYLRLLGFDTLYRNDYADDTLAHLSGNERRILLTRDRGLLKRSIVTYGYCLRTTTPRQQLIEVLHRFDLFEKIAPFRRCLECNGLLQPVEKAAISHLLPPNTQKYYTDFYQCQHCRQLYWPGSHYQRMLRFIESIQVQAPSTSS